MIEEHLNRFLSTVSILPVLLKIILLVSVELFLTIYRKLTGVYKKFEYELEQIVCKTASNLQKSPEKPVAIVTGANCGIGLEISVYLYLAGYHVILACRNKQKGEEALNYVISHKSSGFCELMLLDLSSLESVRSFSKRFLEKKTNLKLLINNAGLSKLGYNKTKDGLEEHFQVNYLAPFLLTQLLTEKLIQSKPSKVINTSSGAHYFCKDLDLPSVFFDESYYRKELIYSQTKLAQVLHVYKFNRDFEKDGVKAFACHPGIVCTEFARHNILTNIALKGLKFFIKSPKTGSFTTVFAALNDIQSPKSLYWAEHVPVLPNRCSENVDLQEKLWEMSVQELKGRE